MRRLRLLTGGLGSDQTTGLRNVDEQSVQAPARWYEFITRRPAERSPAPPGQPESLGRRRR